MGNKVTPDNITQIDNSSGVATVNDNFDLVADEFDKVMYRDGSQTATGDTDMDSNRIINLPDALTPTEPVPRRQIEELTKHVHKGDTGPVANTYFDLPTFQAQDVSNGSATLNLNGVRTDYARSFGDESANPLAIESTSTPGVWWVPQQASGISFTPDVSGAEAISVQKAIIDGVLHVTSLPIANDGVTDDSALILAALTSGARRVSFKGVDAAVSAMLLSGVSDLTIAGDGGKLRKITGSGSNSLIFNLKGGCSRIKISGFSDLDGGYDSSDPTTGSNPVILIGDQNGTGDGGSTNEDIDVLFNGIRRSNWGAVVVYGRSSSDLTMTPQNRRIRVKWNTITDIAGSGVFVYKNSDDVEVSHNMMDGLGYNGVVFDTMAASDTVTSEPINRVRVVGNTILNFGKTGQGEAILFKGLINQFIARDNIANNALVQPLGSFQNWAVLVNKDAAGNAPTNGLIDGGFIEDIDASALGGALGINIGEGCKKITVANHRITRVRHAALYINAGCEDITIFNINIEDSGDGFYMMRAVGTALLPIKRLKLIHCTARKGTAPTYAPTGGFNFAYCQDLEIIDTDAPEFTSSQIVVDANSTWARASEVAGWLRGSKAFDWPSLNTSTQQSTTIINVYGAAVGDFVEVSNSTALSGTRIWGEVTAANTVTVYHRNDTGAPVDVPSGTLRARVVK